MEPFNTNPVYKENRIIYGSQFDCNSGICKPENIRTIHRRTEVNFQDSAIAKYLPYFKINLRNLRAGA